MKLVECISAGCMMMGLVLGAITGAIAMFLIPIGIGAGIIAISRWNKYMQKQKSISSRIPYPPYGY